MSSGKPYSEIAESTSLLALFKIKTRYYVGEDINTQKKIKHKIIIIKLR